jgi:hypothetical protein
MIVFYKRHTGLGARVQPTLGLATVIYDPYKRDLSWITRFLKVCRIENIRKLQSSFTFS